MTTARTLRVCRRFFLIWSRALHTLPIFFTIHFPPSTPIFCVLRGFFPRVVDTFSVEFFRQSSAARDFFFPSSGPRQTETRKSHGPLFVCDDVFPAKKLFVIVLVDAAVIVWRQLRLFYFLPPRARPLRSISDFPRRTGRVSSVIKFFYDWARARRNVILFRLSHDFFFIARHPAPRVPVAHCVSLRLT